MQVSIDASQVKKFEKTLNALHRSALPVSVRTALNSVAFHVKQHSMPESAKETFVNRRPNFFKANSRVDKASGFNIRTMQSMVGFKPTGAANKAVQELEQQEEGGKIAGRSFIPTKQARTSKNWDKMVKADLRIENMRRAKIINSEKVRFRGQNRSKKQKFVRAAIVAKKLYGKNAFVLGNKWGGGNQTLSRIDRITINKSKGTIKFKRTPIYTYRPNRKITVSRTNFMKRASMESGMNLNKFFQDAAIKQLKKYTSQ